MLVLALDLEDVEEVGRRGVHLDQVLVRLRDRVRELCYLELGGVLGVSLILICSEFMKVRNKVVMMRLTLTYCDSWMPFILTELLLYGENELL